MGVIIPFSFQKKHSETALISLVQEAYVNEVSTHKVERLAKSLGIEGLSATQVSEISKGLNKEVSKQRRHKLNSVYPVTGMDALYKKIRYEGCIISSAVLIIQGLTLEGRHRILAFEPMMETVLKEKNDWLLKEK